MTQATNWPPRPYQRSLSLAILTGILAVSMFVALRSPLKDDIAWLLYCARRWIAGKELYVDVIEVNPPLIVWISAIPLTVARGLNVGQQYVAMPFFAAVALGCAWIGAGLLRARAAVPGGALFADRIPVFSAIGIALLLIPAGDLGQREHLLIAAFLPYLILFAGELDGIRPPRKVAVAVGVLAALGCALKPQYGLAFAALEGVALTRGLRPWRAAPLAAGIALAAYVSSVAIVCPAYLRNAVPMALALYGATDVPFVALLRDTAPLLAAEALALALYWRDRRRAEASPSLLLAGMVFAAVSNVVCFADGKDWFYHRLPASVATVLVLALWLASASRRRPTEGPALGSSGLRTSGRVAGAVLVLLLFGLNAVERLEPEMREAVEPQATTVARLEALIRLHHARTYVAFSEWIALGFPVVNNTGVMWASRFDSMWALKGEIWKARTDPAAAREWPVAGWVAHDFVAACPDIAVVDTREKIAYVAILSVADPSFRKVWARYKQIVAFDGLTVWRRTTASCVDPWVSAQGAVSGRGGAGHATAGTAIR